MSIDTGTQHSPDGTWWWNGAQWTPAMSHDGAYWFNGTRWVPAQQRSRGPLLVRAEWVVSAAWLLLWVLGVAWAIWAGQAAGDAESVAMPMPMLVTGLTLLTATVLGILVTSGWFAARRRWTQVMLFAAALTCLLLAWYVAAMLAVPVPDNQPDIQDDAAGAGLVLLALPTAGVVIVLTAIGAGIGALVGHTRSRRTR